MVSLVASSTAQPTREPPGVVLSPQPQAQTVVEPRPQPVAKPVVKPLPEPVSKPRPEPIAEPRPKPVEPSRAVAAPVTPPAPAVTPSAQAASARAPAGPVVAALSPAPPMTPPLFQADYLRNPPPAYPALSRPMGEQGRVVLRVLVDATGAAQEVQVQTRSPRSCPAARARPAICCSTSRPRISILRTSSTCCGSRGSSPHASGSACSPFCTTRTWPRDTPIA